MTFIIYFILFFFFPFTGGDAVTLRRREVRERLLGQSVKIKGEVIQTSVPF